MMYMGMASVYAPTKEEREQRKRARLLRNELRPKAEAFVAELNALQQKYGLVAFTSDDCCGGFGVQTIDGETGWPADFDYDTGVWTL